MMETFESVKHEGHTGSVIQNVLSYRINHAESLHGDVSAGNAEINLIIWAWGSTYINIYEKKTMAIFPPLFLQLILQQSASILQSSFLAGSENDHSLEGTSDIFIYPEAQGEAIEHI